MVELIAAAVGGTVIGAAVGAHVGFKRGVKRTGDAYSALLRLMFVAARPVANSPLPVSISEVPKC